MRFMLLVCLALAAPASAQVADGDPVIGKRVGKLESEMRAVQRKVFPGGDARFFESEIPPAAPVPSEAVGNPASAPLNDLTARVGELEAQLRTLTGQVEANQFKVKQLEDALAKFRGDAEFRLGALEGGGAARPAGDVPLAAAEPAPAVQAPPRPAVAAAPASPDAQWRAAYALVIAKDHPAAETALTDFLAANPKSPRAADAQYWLGKTYAAQNAPAQAAKAYLDGYKKYPKGTRAPESLYGLASALIDLKKPDQACRSLNELDTVYGSKLTTAVKAQATKARLTAKCDKP